jgi:HK97 family phage portal protein
VIAGWKAKLSREGGASEPLVVDGGATIEGVSGANDMESITSARTAAMAEVARALGVPYAFLAAAEAGTQIDLAATRTLCDQTLFPWARRIENELQEKLFPGYRLEHDLTELKRGSIKEHARDLAKLVMAGVLTPNDARWFLGVEPHEDGDELTVRLDTVNGQAVHNDEQQEDETNEAGDN